MKRPLSPGLVLVVAVAAIGWAGPLVRLSHAPSLAIAAWRLVFSVGVIAVIATVLPTGRVWPRGREWIAAIGAGVALAAHFWAWIASVSLTTVSSSVALVSMQPVFVAVLSATVLREPPSARQWAGIGVACAGALVIGWGDFGRGADPVLGDALALLGAVLVSIYYIIGRRLRQRLDLWGYVGVVYGVAALILLGLAALTPGVPVLAYPAREWLLFLAIAAFPTMLGHTGANYALRYFRAYVVNLALLGEPVIATLLAWGLPSIREAPPVQTVIGGLLIVAGIAAGVIARGGATRHVGAPETGTSSNTVEGRSGRNG